MSESQLPNELIREILSYLPVQVLSSASAVSTRWKPIAEHVFSQRFQAFRNLYIGPEADDGGSEIRSELESYFSNPTSWKIMSKFEETRLVGLPGAVPYLEEGDRDGEAGGGQGGAGDCPSHAQVVKNFESFILYVMKEWFQDIAENHGRPYHFNLTDKVKFVPSHKLVFYVNSKPEVQAFHQMDIFNYVEFETANETEPSTQPPTNNLVPYTITYTSSADKNYGDPASQTFVDVSVYNDHLVMICTNTRRLMYYQISKVDHQKREIELTPLRQIFLPWSPHEIMLFKNKVFIIFGTGHFGVWKKTDAVGLDTFEMELELSRREIRYPLLSGLNRLNNFIIVKCPYPTRRWYLLDANQDGINMERLDMDYLILQVMFSRFGFEIDAVGIDDLYLQNNMMIVKLTRHNASVPGTSSILVMQLKNPLTRDHLLNYEYFVENVGTWEFLIQKADRICILPIPFKPNVRDSSKLLLAIIPNGPTLDVADEEIDEEFDYLSSMNNYCGGKVLYKITDDIQSPLPFTPAH